MSLKGEMLSCLAYVITPTNPLSHLHPSHFMLLEFKDLVAKQHSTNTHTHIIPVACLRGSHVCQKAVEILPLTLNTHTHAR